MNITHSLLSGTRRLVLLAPSQAAVPRVLRKVEDGTRYDRLMSSMQRLRGSIYLNDGAIREWQLTPDGRHTTEGDAKGWHMLVLNGDDRVVGCARYLYYPIGVSFDSLGVSRSPLACSERWGTLLRAAVEREMADASRRRLAYVELGGWALAEETRSSADALRIALASYALCNLLGVGMGLSTATYRHHSCSILKRVGGRPLAIDNCEIPSYYDPQYECDMQILSFDSRTSNPRYGAMLADLESQLLVAPVYQSSCDQMYSLGARLLQGTLAAASTELEVSFRGPSTYSLAFEKPI